MQREARALGDPTRHRLFRYIASAPAPVSVAELTGFVRLHHNAVRQHLAVLSDAGLVIEQAERRGGPGRPRLLYRLHPEAAGAWGTAGPYTWLAGMLSAAVRRGQSARQAGRQEGRRRAASLARPGDPVVALEEELTRRGFRPRRAGRGPAVELVLGRCPFADVAAVDPETVCQLHLGLAEGLAEGLGGLVVEGLAVQEPQRAGCRLAVRRDPAARPGPEPAGPAGGHEGGEPACWAHLVCPDCGAVESEGHRPGCEQGRPAG
jgi:predicted ArsR family transcriptional regulator